MTCDETKKLLHAYIDDELDIPAALQIESHLPLCPSCLGDLEAAQVVRRAASQPGLYHPAPTALRDWLEKTIHVESVSGQDPREIRRKARWWRNPFALSAVAAALLLVIVSLTLLPPSRGSSDQISELVASHLRSLEASHLLDVESTDQHTVKPWFAGKVDFSPPVVDLSAEGFPLIGGRLDYLSRQNVAALVYRRQKHLINLFIRPGEATAEADEKQGFNLIRFQCKGMICWAISDLNAGELQQFVDLFKAQKAASNRS